METMRSPSPGRRAPACWRHNRSLPSHPHASASKVFVPFMPSPQALSGLPNLRRRKYLSRKHGTAACTMPPFDLADREHTRRLFHDLHRRFPARPLEHTQGRRNSTAYSTLISTRTGPVPLAFGTGPISMVQPTHAGRARHRTTKHCFSSLQRARQIFRRS